VLASAQYGKIFIAIPPLYGLPFQYRKQYWPLRNLSFTLSLFFCFSGFQFQYRKQYWPLRNSHQCNRPSAQKARFVSIPQAVLASAQ
ncbi:MAG: hypothetical protein IJQ01_09005, partial [Selenomonadaceae bacterium]|nr:hypothetical protein [Selenomonadaceae bacterium]